MSQKLIGLYLHVVWPVCLCWPQTVRLTNPRKGKRSISCRTTFSAVIETLSYLIVKLKNSNSFFNQVDWILRYVHYQLPYQQKLCWILGVLLDAMLIVVLIIFTLHSLCSVTQWLDVSSTASLPWCTRFLVWCLLFAVIVIWKYTKQNETEPTQKQCYHQTHVLIVSPSRHNTGISSKPTHASTPDM
jgi:hypothetical protein